MGPKDPSKTGTVKGSLDEKLSQRIQARRDEIFEGYLDDIKGTEGHRKMMTYARKNLEVHPNAEEEETGTPVKKLYPDEDLAEASNDDIDSLIQKKEWELLSLTRRSVRVNNSVSKDPMKAWRAQAVRGKIAQLSAEIASLKQQKSANLSEDNKTTINNLQKQKLDMKSKMDSIDLQIKSLQAQDSDSQPGKGSAKGSIEFKDKFGKMKISQLKKIINDAVKEFDLDPSWKASSGNDKDVTIGEIDSLCNEKGLTPRWPEGKLVRAAYGQKSNY